MESTVLSFINKHQLLTRNSTVIAGVSGGPDSMALLHFLCTIRKTWNLRVVAVSLDHGLRGTEAQEDLAHVERYCIKWGVTFIGAYRNVQAYKEVQKVGTQVAAREMRYRFFREQMARHQADYLALGHHGDDQAETMLMNLARTASSNSFSGIPVKRQFAAGQLIRPLLCVAKSDISTYLNKHQIQSRLDPSNEKTDYTRNHFRKNILPLLKERNSNLHRTVQHLSESLQADEEYLAGEAAIFLENVVQFDKKGKTARFAIDRFKSRAVALQRRAYHLILNYLYDRMPGNLSYVHEDDFFALLESDKSSLCIDFPGDLKVEKSYGNCVLSFRKQCGIHADFHTALPVPGTVTLPDGAVITSAYTDIPDSRDEYTYICRPEEIVMPLHIRSRRNGDRMGWKGLEGTKKIKDIFIDAKIPRAMRETWPLVIDNHGNILWLIGLKKGQTISDSEGPGYIQLTYKKGKMQEGKHA